jgi:hypothetical protein
MRLKLILLYCLSTSLCSCQSGPEALTTFDAAPSLSAPAASAIAGDLSGRFAEQAGTVSKTVRMQGDGTPFASSLAAAMQGWGYTVATDNGRPAEKDGPAPVELHYALTNLDGQVLARLSTDTISVSRVYSVTATGATPASPLSMMKRN